MRVLLFALAAALGALFLVPAAGSLAAPDNKNTFTIEVSCETHGDIPVTISGRSNADVGFTEDGPAIVKKEVETDTTTLAIEGGPTLTFGPDTFETAVPGAGFQDKLERCTFELTFEDTFRLSRRAIRDLELDPSLLGATVHVTSHVEGTVWVIFPGQ